MVSLKTIKRKRQVRLDGLMKYAWDNNITRTRFEGKDCSIYVDDRGNFKVADEYSLCKSDLYTIEEEVEITEEIPLNLVDVYVNYTGRLQCNANEHITIRHLLQVNNSEDVKTKFIYLQNEDGSIGELIWKDGKLI